MGRRCLALAALAALLAAGDAHAHAFLLTANPPAGAALGDNPTAVQLTFSEAPEPSLATIEVWDRDGRRVQTGAVTPDQRDGRTVAVRLRPLSRGIYTVAWRVVSAVDGHALAGTYAFGVGVTPDRAAAAAGGAPTTSKLEFAARWIFLTGLVLLIGSAAASVARFGSAKDVAVAAVGWVVAATGLVLLFEAQRRVAEASFDQLLDTAVGEDLVWRAVALGAAGFVLVLAAFALEPVRTLALAGVGAAAAVAVAVHVAAGHAATGGSSHALNILAQWAHVLAVGVWLGGLAALLVGVRGSPSERTAAAVRRFSAVAAAGLLVVLATGITRSVVELTAWSDLYSTGYGRAVVAKIALLALVAGFGAINRRRSLPRAGSDLRPLRRTARLELTVAAGALAVAALLGTVAPPAAGRGQQPGFDVSATDADGSVRVHLTTASTQAGPNRFLVRADDVEADTPIDLARVTLRFTPLDDPGTPSTTLALGRVGRGTYAGSGSNLAFDGRWGITALVRRDAGTVSVPLEVEALGPPQFVSIVRTPGRPPRYDVDLAPPGAISISPDPERAGRSRLTVTVYDLALNERAIDSLIVTAGSPGARTTRLPIRRVSESTFVADAMLVEGTNRIGVVARPPDGTRLRAAIDLDVPAADE